jgi:hypothetical protein
MKINEGLAAIKMLSNRIGELQRLRSENASQTSFSNYSSKEVMEKREPMYNVKKLDKLISRLSRDMRLLDSAIKTTNSSVDVVGYSGKSLTDIDLGELEDFDTEKK